jgi:hemerythrin-like domain-containing protein
MGPLGLLTAEHRVIETVLDTLDDLAAAAGRGEAADGERLAGSVAFLRGYADAIHHGKEERILFAAVERGRAPANLTQLLAGLRREHETARLLTDDLAAFAALPAPWSEADRVRIRRVAGEYTSLLRRHIAAEDGTVFPIIAAALSSAALRSVASAFERFEAAHAAQRDGLRAWAEARVAR